MILSETLCVTITQSIQIARSFDSTGTMGYRLIFLYYFYFFVITAMPTEELAMMTVDERSDIPVKSCPQAAPKVRILAAVPRSGSTLFMRIFQEAVECAVTSRLILMGNHGLRGNFRPDYTIFQNPEALAVYCEAQARGKSILINKEELGHECWNGECDYEIFPDKSYIERTEPTFLFRDPLRVFDSWKAVGWTDIDSLLIAYRHLYHTWSACDQSAIAITYEELINFPDQTLERLCHHWRIGFSHDLLTFQHPFGEFLFGSERERRIYSVDNPLGLFNTVQSNQTVRGERPYRTKSRWHLHGYLWGQGQSCEGRFVAVDTFRLRPRRYPPRVSQSIRGNIGVHLRVSF